MSDLSNRPVYADDHAGERPAAPSSALSGLRQQRKKIEEKLHLDLRIPRYDDPGVYVRYRPITSGQMQRISKRAQESKDPDAIAIANATVIAEAAVGVFELDEHGKPIGKPEDWTPFGPELAEHIGEPDLTRAADVVRAVFFTDGDITSTVNKLTEWSGFAAGDALEEYSGN